MNPARPGTFERVYGAIKDFIRDGRYRPGERLEPAALADELNASVTPVRDALHRLTGERLLEALPHEGFRIPLLTETGLRQLYSWHRDLLFLAVVNRRPSVNGPIPSAIGAASTHDHFFRALAAMAENPECESAILGLLDRLAPIQALERQILDAVEDESKRIAQALEEGERKKVRQALLAYHRRRQHIVPAILHRLYGAQRSSSERAPPQH